MMDDFLKRVLAVVDDVKLAENFYVTVGHDEPPLGARLYLQIKCWRKDVVTDEMGWGQGGKAHLSPWATDSELVQTVFGLYKGYWEHEARETFEWRGRRVFGPHIDTQALWEVAERTDARPAEVER